MRKEKKTYQMVEIRHLFEGGEHEVPCDGTQLHLDPWDREYPPRTIEVDVKIPSVHKKTRKLDDTQPIGDLFE